MRTAALLVCVALALSMHVPNYELQFLQFVQKFNKVYAHDAEVAQRFEVFKNNVNKINSHNNLNMGWTMDINEFADLTWEEFSEGRLGLVQSVERSAERVDLSEVINAPSSVDWNSKGAVTEVKNQGQCGSCYAFSTTGAIEGAVAIKTGRLTSLSEQQLVDCSTANDGCDGGDTVSAFEFVINNGGLCPESSYPYEAVKGSCKSSCSKVSTIRSYANVRKYSESALLAAVANQPVTVSINADQDAFHFYSGGIMTGKCGTKLDHSVLVTGYGSDNGVDYWTIKNSWGDSWGDNGYIRIQRNVQSEVGMCGITIMPSYPIA